MQIAICIIGFIVNFISLLLVIKIDVGFCTIGDVILAFFLSLISLTGLAPVPLVGAIFLAFIPTIAALLAIAILKLENSGLFGKKLF